MKITFVDTLGSTPARVNRLTGEIVVSKKFWEKLPKPYRRFIIEHEKGHYHLQTTNELAADRYAFEKMAGKFHKSLKTMVKTLADVLPFRTQSHQVRLLNLYKMALEHDQQNNPQPQTERELEDIKKRLSNFSNNLEYMQYELIYSQQRKGKPRDYDMGKPSFQPSIGRYFHDVSMLQTEFEKQYRPTAQTGYEKQCRPIAKPKPAKMDRAKQVQKRVPTNSLPGYKRITIDLKTVAIIILAVLIVLGIKKLA